VNRLTFAIFLGLQALVLASLSSQAQDTGLNQSPWFGGEGQKPFRIKLQPSDQATIPIKCVEQGHLADGTQGKRKSCIAKEARLELQKLVLVSP
jgi:hypothetical protein